MIVHCSAGCGRSAAFLTILSTLQTLSNSDTVDNCDLVYEQVNGFRIDRVGSVQNLSQFMFCYDAVVTKLWMIVNEDEKHNLDS
jgi:protein tyrosine phosphatase